MDSIKLACSGGSYTNQLDMSIESKNHALSPRKSISTYLCLRFRAVNILLGFSDEQVRSAFQRAARGVVWILNFFSCEVWETQVWIPPLPVGI